MCLCERVCVCVCVHALYVCLSVPASLPLMRVILFQDVGANLAFWGFIDADGMPPEYDCGNPVGTYCGSGVTDSPGYTYDPLTSVLN